MALGFANIPQLGMFGVYSDNVMASSFPKASRSGIFEARSGRIIAMSFPKDPQPDTSEAYFADAMVSKSVPTHELEGQPW